MTWKRDNMYKLISNSARLWIGDATQRSSLWISAARKIMALISTGPPPILCLHSHLTRCRLSQTSSPFKPRPTSLAAINTTSVPSLIDIPVMQRYELLYFTPLTRFSLVFQRYIPNIPVVRTTTLSGSNTGCLRHVKPYQVLAHSQSAGPDDEVSFGFDHLPFRILTHTFS